MGVARVKRATVDGSKMREAPHGACRLRYPAASVRSRIGYRDHDRERNASRATINGASADDRITGTEVDDTIRAKRGDDDVAGGGGDDELHGGRGNDRLFGGRGDDELLAGPDGGEARGGQGDDYLAVNGGLASGGEGSDRLYTYMGENAATWTFQRGDDGEGGAFSDAFTAMAVEDGMAARVVVLDFRPNDRFALHAQPNGAFLDAETVFTLLDQNGDRVLSAADGGSSFGSVTSDVAANSISLEWQGDVFELHGATALADSMLMT
jgi:Ca2+-binding RTX toxin-like protein